ncbi:MAG: glycosyltransferase family 2 protein [Pyrinomonadaceae bacterium]|nr:glycosyltransferase family 2 protein [Pyrinomonadaceae bacterium]
MNDTKEVLLPGKIVDLTLLHMISLVIPLYNEEDVVNALHQKVVGTMETLGHAWEVVYVDDGSRDRSLELLLAHQAIDPRVTVVELSRNWGHQPALTAGLSVAKGSAVVLMDGDLQDSPEVIPDLIAAWQKGAQVVIAERRSRKERGLRRWLFPLFYKALGYLSDYPIPLNAGIFGLLDRQAVDSISRLTESNRYLPGLRAWIGFKTAVVYYERAERAAGEPKQNFWRLLKYALDAIFSFSYKPLRLSLFLGMFTAAFALIYGIVLVISRFLGLGMFGLPVVTGYTSTIVSILLLSGVQLICVGLLGEYIGRIYDEVKRRPLFLIHSIHQSEAKRGLSRASQPR